MFPFVIAGHITTNPRGKSEIDKFIDRLAVDLRARGIAPDITGSEISFLNNKSFFLQSLPFALFKGVDGGTFDIRETSVHYRLSCALSLILPLSMAGIFLLLGLVTGSTPIIVFVCIWMLMVLLVFAEMQWRLRRLLRRLADSASP